MARRRAPAEGRPASSRTSRRATWTRPRSTTRFEQLADDYGNIAELITLPNKTNGYQRRAQALMEGTVALGQRAAHQRRPARRAAQPRRRADLARLGPRGRQRRSPPSSSRRATANSPLIGHGDRQRHPGDAGDRRRQRREQHRGAGRRGDQRQHAGRRARQGDDLPQRGRHRHRRGRARRSTCPTSSTARDQSGNIINGHVPARAVRVQGDADRQAPGRLEGRRLPVLPAARPRVGDAADVPGDRAAAAHQLRDRPGDARVRRQPRHLHPAVVQPGRRALLDVQLQQPAQEPDELVRRGRQGDRRPVRGELLAAAPEPEPEPAAGRR